MAYETKEGQGSLFKVKDKEGNENRPDYRGACLIGGTHYRIAGWLKIAKSGERYISLKIELPMSHRTPDAKIDPDADIPL